MFARVIHIPCTFETFGFSRNSLRFQNRWISLSVTNASSIAIDALHSASTQCTSVYVSEVRILQPCISNPPGNTNPHLIIILLKLEDSCLHTPQIKLN